MALDAASILRKIQPNFLAKSQEIPLPKTNPLDRLWQLLVWRNERRLYKRNCDLTGKSMISAYAPGTELRVYSHDAWWGDSWAPEQYARDFDFSRPFFEQFGELIRAVPRLALVNNHSENSAYNNWVIWLKNCYLLTGARDDQDCYYGHWIWRCRDCVDCFHVYDSELCYECIDCRHCYNLKFSQECRDSKDGLFLFDCVGCFDCVACVGLRNARFQWFNQQLNEADYRARLAELTPLSLSNLETLRRQFTDHLSKLAAFVPENRLCEDCSGSYLEGCQNVNHCYEAQDCRDCLNSMSLMHCNDMLDSLRSAYSEMGFSSISAVNSCRVMCSIMCWYCSEVYYADSCSNCSSLFGCTALRRSSNCIFNNSFTRHDYESQLKRITGHMRETGEWGLFFPPELSLFCYNETIASDYFPLDREEVLARGLRWFEDKDIPDHQESEENLNKNTVQCTLSGKVFQLTTAEQKFYRTNQLPNPTLHPEERHQARLKQRVPLQSGLGYSLEGTTRD